MRRFLLVRKNALIALNILYVLVGFLLIGVGVYGRAASMVTNLPIVGGILACGIILILISMLGLVGAVKHHQVMLFFYMIILFLLFLIQISIACSCLAVSSEQQKEFAEQGWARVPETIKIEVEDTFYCCGFNGTSSECKDINRPCCAIWMFNGICKCPDCLPVLEGKINYAFKLCGGIGLFFSFTEVLAVFLTWRYRNQHNPDDLPARAIFPPRSSYQY